MTITWILVCLVIIFAGIWAGRGVTSKQWVGNDRSLGPVAVGCVLAATQIGGMSIIGAAQNGYTLGIAASWYSIGNGAYLLMYALIAGILRDKMPTVTIPDYLEKRFSKYSSGLYSYIWLVMGFIYIPIQLKTIAGIIQTVFPALNSNAAIVVGLTMGAVYTAIAGMKGSSIIGKITCFGTYIVLAIFLIMNFGQFGGYSGLVSTLPSEFGSFTNGYPVSTIISYVLGGTISGFVMQTFVQALLSAKSTKAARTGSLIGYLLAGPISILAGIIGMMARASTPDLGDGSTAFAWVVSKYSDPMMAGLIMAMVTMIIVATVAGMILANGSIISRIYRTQINPDVDERKLLKFTRGGTLVFAYLSLIAAFLIPSAELTNMFLTLAYSTTTPASFSIIAGIFWKKATPQASFTSMICGVLTGVAWQVFKLSYIMQAVYAITIVTFGVGIIVTLLTAPKEIPSKI